MPDFLNPLLLSPKPEFRQVTAIAIVGLATGALNIVDLHFEWDISKTIGPEPDYGTLRIYNLNNTSRQELDASFKSAQFALNAAAGIGAAAAIAPLATLGVTIEPQAFAQVTLFVGWKNRAELLYAGEVISQRTAEYTDTDVITTLTLGDAAVSMRDAPAPGGAAFGLGAQFVIAFLAEKLGLTVSPPVLAIIAQKAATLPIQDFQVDYTGDANVQLRDFLATLGLNLSTDGGELVVFDNGVRLDLTPVQLSAAFGGLLTWSPVDDGGWRMTALAEPRVVPGRSLACFDSSSMPIGEEPLRCQSVRFTGTNDGPSLMELEARPIRPVGGNVGFI